MFSVLLTTLLGGCAYHHRDSAHNYATGTESPWSFQTVEINAEIEHFAKAAFDTLDKHPGILKINSAQSFTREHVTRYQIEICDTDLSIWRAWIDQKKSGFWKVQKLVKIAERVRVFKPTN